MLGRARKGSDLKALKATLLVFLGLNSAATFLAGPCFAQPQEQAKSPLDGTWVRVFDGCTDLPLEEVANLSKSGGGNGLVRSMVLTFSGNQFSAQVLPSPRCSHDFTPRGLQSDQQTRYCRNAINDGSVELQGDFAILEAKNRESYNPWGSVYRLWKYRIVNDVLVMTTKYYACGEQTFKVYFIRSTGV